MLVPPLVSLALLLFVALVVLMLAVVHGLARTLLYPARMTDGKALYVLRRMSPGDVGLPFESISFDVRDHATGQSLSIAAWWIAAASAGCSRTCVIVHGYGDAKVGALAWAPTWRELGFHVLLIDLRGHGESGGDACTGGFREREDLDAVLDQLRSRFHRETTQLVLFGISLGGAVVLATAAARDDVDAVIADGVFADYRSAILTHADLIKAPLRTLTPLAIRWAERMAGCRFDAVRPVDTIRVCRCGVMLIHGGCDPFVPADQVERLHQAMASRGNALDEHHVITDAGHCLGIVADASAYAGQLRRFVERAISAHGAASSRA